MKIPFLKSTSESSASVRADAPVPDPSAVVAAQFFVFKNMAFVGQQSFAKSRITIGSGTEADLILEHQDIADIHASLFLDNNKLILSNRHPENGLRLNGQPVSLSFLEPPGVIELGPYRIQVAVAADSPVAAAAPAIADSTKVDNTAAQPTHREASPSKASSNSEPEYELIWQGDIEPNRNRDIVCQQLAMLFRTSPGSLMPIVAGERVFAKRGLDRTTALRLQKALAKLGALAHVAREDGRGEKSPIITTPEAAVDQSPAEPAARKAPTPIRLHPVQAKAKRPVGPAISTEPFSLPPIESLSPSAAGNITAQTTVDADKSTAEIVPAVATVTALRSAAKPGGAEHPVTGDAAAAATIANHAVPQWDDDEDEDDDDVEATFLLRDKLLPATTGGRTPAGRMASGQMVLEVIGLRNGDVVDVHHLHRNESFSIYRGKRKFCLAAHNKLGKCHVSFHSEMGGQWQRGGDPSLELDQLKNSRYLHHPRKKIYRCRLNATDRITIRNDHLDYEIRPVWLPPSPRVFEPAKSEMLTWRHFAGSTAVHFVFIMLLGVAAVLNVTPKEDTEPRFVQIDPSQLLAEHKPAPKPKPVAPKPKPAPKKVVPMDKTTVAKKRQPKHTSNRQVVASRHPKAGGGYGKGNVTNRNINQAGILSLLGDNTVSRDPSPTLIAAVTNLDAVSSPGASENNFSVGGVKGSLGNGKIAIPTSEVIETKGGNQVLRSYGAGGKGTVAALKKGKVGQKQVAGMVTAKLTKAVTIRGGLSMAEVKQVIDQHLSEVSYCYETALLANPSIMGRIVYEWKILKSGRVGEVRIQNSSINSHEIHNCIKAAIQTWQFPKPRGADEVYVSYPFIFDVVGF